MSPTGPAGPTSAGAAAAARIGITGVGYAVPENIRTNDDPIFAWLVGHPVAGNDLFYGYDERRVLQPRESAIDLMVPAAMQALAAANLAPRDVDVLLGYASVSEYVMPNALTHLHAMLGLRRSTWAIPVNADYSNFNASLLLADSLIRAGQAERALIVCGGNWSQYVDYHTAPSVSAADGAGAAVLRTSAEPSHFRLVDSETEVQAQYYGVMYQQPDILEPAVSPAPGTRVPGARVPGEGLSDRASYTQPYFHLTQAGLQGFSAFGEAVPPLVVGRLLERNGLAGSDVAIIAHQTSLALIELWTKAIGPAQFLHTLSTFANMTVANIPVNLACLYDQIQTDYLVLLSLGPEMHTNALLLRRNG
jgi:3-oxoacyl-[acyl-carrier-protein] synthase-3